MENKTCGCGCGGEITPKRNHKYVQARFLPGHNTRTDSLTGIVRRKDHYIPKPEEIPSGLCECGCGQPTAISQETSRKRRYFIGHPMPCLPHHSRKRLRENNPRWIGGRIYNRGYVLLYMPGDPRANSKGYIPEHRVVWEEANGRALQPGEEVHHKNRKRDDNRPENLDVLTKSEHTREHNIEENRARFMRGHERGRHKKQ